jgi:DNA repair protein RadC
MTNELRGSGRPARVTEDFTMIVLKNFERSPRLAELRVSYKRRAKAEPGQLTMPFALRTPQTAEEYLRSVWDEDRFDYAEDFLVLCLNTALEPLGWVRVSSGGQDQAVVDPRVIFGVALQTAATAIIVAHNHPSGRVEPSAEDRAMTKRLKEAGLLIGVRVIDHIILSRDAAYSFADRESF